ADGPPRPAPRPAHAKSRRTRSPEAPPATRPAASPAAVTLTVIDHPALWATRVRVDSRPGCALRFLSDNPARAARRPARPQPGPPTARPAIRADEPDADPARPREHGWPAPKSRPADLRRPRGPGRCRRPRGRGTRGGRR